jgi:hypothetical protein
MASFEEHKFIRILYVIFYYFIFGLCHVLLLFTAILQTLLNIFYDGPNENLQKFSASLGVYVKQVVEYVGYVSEEKPFPFSDWPEVQ